MVVSFWGCILPLSPWQRALPKRRSVISKESFKEMITPCFKLPLSSCRTLNERLPCPTIQGPDAVITWRWALTKLAMFSWKEPKAKGVTKGLQLLSCSCPSTNECCSCKLVTGNPSNAHSHHRGYILGWPCRTKNSTGAILPENLLPHCWQRGVWREQIYLLQESAAPTIHLKEPLIMLIIMPRYYVSCFRSRSDFSQLMTIPQASADLMK